MSTLKKIIKEKWWIILIVFFVLFKILPSKSSDQSSTDNSTNKRIGKTYICFYCGRPIPPDQPHYYLPNSLYSDYKFCSKRCLRDWASLAGINVTFSDY